VQPVMSLVFVFILVLYSDDADLQNFLDLRTDNGSVMHKKLRTRTDADPIPSISSARI